jgi:hypothetical protein
MTNHLWPKDGSILLELRRRAKRWRNVTRLVRVALLALALGVFVGTASAQSPGASATAGQLLQDGNTASANGHPGAAVLDYERAQWLAPHDATVARQLATVRQHDGLTTPPAAQTQHITHALSFDALTALASISLILFCFLMFATRLIPTTLRGLAHGVAAGGGAIALFAVSCVGLRWPELRRAVVLSSNASAHIAPANNAAKLFELKAGDVVHVRKTYGQFVQVRAADGRGGWLSGNEVEKIIPAAS